ncbi:MAG: amidase [Acidobacteria bacterium]|nr:amidase [Acidobacteriota bacterium]
MSIISDAYRIWRSRPTESGRTAAPVTDGSGGGRGSYDARVRTLAAVSLTLLIALPSFTAVGAQAPPPFSVEEASIADIHAAFRAGRLTCRGLVERYLRRIDAYDKNSPAVNAIVMVNPRALTEADALDARFKASGQVGPLHCVPTIVKDNFETVGMQSSNGSLTFEGYVPATDAFQVARIKAAGAIVLAKSNLAEWAFTPNETLSSILPGYTKNPYALDRVTAGSSGGTAAAVAASFGAVGLGSDTGNSIRGPSSHQALVGIRSTMGLTSRAGVFPLSLLADIAGPMGRTVADVTAVFQVVVGEDPNDAVTMAARGRTIPTYADALTRDALRGMRIGVLRQAYERDTTDPEIVQIFSRAVDDLKLAGAVIVDPATVEGLDAIRRQPGLASCQGFKHDINQFLAARQGRVPVADLAAVVKGGKFHPTVQRRLEQAEQGPALGPETDECKAEAAYRDQVRAAVLATMDALTLDAFVYPTWSNPPRLIGDLNTPGGDNSQFFSPTTGWPSVQVPMGYSRGGLLPAGLTFFGRAWSEATLLGAAYAYEQATTHRRPPPTTPQFR